MTVIYTDVPRKWSSYGHHAQFSGVEYGVSGARRGRPPQTWASFLRQGSGAVCHDLAAWLARELTPVTLRELSAAFGLTHPDSVRNLIRRADRALLGSHMLRGEIEAIRHRLPKTENRAFYEFAEVKLRGSVFSSESWFSSSRRTFHVSIQPPVSMTCRLRQVGEPGGPRLSHPPSPFCSHAPSRPLQCLSSSRAGGFVRCATSSGRHDLLSVCARS